MKKFLTLAILLILSANANAGISQGSYNSSIKGSEKVELTAEQKRNSLLKNYYPHIVKCMNVVDGVHGIQNHPDSAKFNFLMQKSVADFAKYKKKIEESFTLDEVKYYGSQKSNYTMSKCIKLVAELDQNNKNNSLSNVNNSVSINLNDNVQIAPGISRTYKIIMEESVVCSMLIPMYKDVGNKGEIADNFLSYAKGLNRLSGNQYNIDRMLQKQSVRLIGTVDSLSLTKQQADSCLTLYNFVYSDVKRILNDR